jgi:hypothetical protein
MNKPSSKVRQGLIQALLKTARSPDLTDAEVNWLNQFAVYLIAEFSALKAEDRELAA